MPLANITIAGASSDAGSVTVNGGSGQHGGPKYGEHGGKPGNATGGPETRFENKVLYVTGLEGSTSGGVWSDDLDIKFE